MNLPFHFTDGGNQDFLVVCLFVVFVVAVVALLVVVLFNDKKTASIKAVATVLAVVGAVSLVFYLQQSIERHRKLDAESDRVNSYNLQLLKRETAARYDVQLNTKQAQDLLDNYVYNQPRDTWSDPAKPARIEVAGAQTDVKLTHEGKRWYLFSTSQELLPVR